MKLYLDTSTCTLAEFANRQPVSKINAKRGDMIELEVVPSTDLTTATGILAAKAKGVYSGEPVVLDSSWTAPETEGAGYLFALSLNTSELAALFTGETAEVVLMAEVTWMLDGAVRSSQTFDLVVARDVWRGDEGTPATALDLKANQAEAEAGSDNTKWMTPLRTSQAIAALFEGDGMGVPYDLGNFGEGVTLSVDNGTLQRGMMTADTTIAIAGVEGMEGKQLTLSFWTNGGDWTLNFSGVQMSAEALALLPIALTNGRSYVLRFACVGYLWTLQEIYGPTLVD